MSDAYAHVRRVADMALAQVREEARERDRAMWWQRWSDEYVEAARTKRNRLRLLREEFSAPAGITVALGPGQYDLRVCPSCIGRGCDRCEDMGVEHA